MHARDSEFYRWMIHQARLMGWDLDATEEVAPGVHAPLSRILLIWAAIAMNGLTPEQTDHLAQGFGVTPDELTAAYLPEMRREAMSEILEQPDLAQLDARLDEIARDA